MVAGHFDGIGKMSTSTLSSWMQAAEQHADSMRAAGFPDTWEMTASEVKKLESVRPGWLASIQARGVSLVPREPHLNDLGGDAWAAAKALAAAGGAPSMFLGSVLDPMKYVGGPWLVVGTGGTPGHTSDSDLSGLKALSPDLAALYTGTAASVAIKNKVAKMVDRGELPNAYEIVRYNGADPKTGGQPWFASPARHDGAQAPVPILEDLQRLQGELSEGGLSGIVIWTTYETMFRAWESAGKPSPYVVPKS